MPVAKLRFTAVMSDIVRLSVRAFRRAWMVLLLPMLGLVALWLLVAFGVGPPESTPVPVRIAVSGAVLLLDWLLVLVFVRAALGDQTGFALLRIDGPALMLLGLDLIYTGLTALPAPRAPGLRMLDSVATFAAELIWLRMTLLLSVAWALGLRGVTVAASWRGLRGNFLRALCFGGACFLLLTTVLLACMVWRTGHLDSPVQALGMVPFAILAGLGGLVQLALPCAIYRQLSLAATERPASAGLTTVNA